MKILLLSIMLSLNLFTSSMINADEPPPMVELYIYNRSNSDKYIKLYPVSSLINSTTFSSNTVHRSSIFTNLYDPEITNSGAVRKPAENTSLPRITTLVGLDGYSLSNPSWPGYFKIAPEQSAIFSLEGSYTGEQDGLIGFGIYHLEIYYLNGENFMIGESIIMDWLDLNYGTSAFHGKPDLLFYINGSNPSDITYKWTGGGSDGDEIPIFGNVPYPCPSNARVEIYKQYHKYVSGAWTGHNVPVITNPRKVGNVQSSEFSLIFPSDGRDVPSPQNITKHLNSGKLEGNVTFTHDISTRTVLLDNPTNIILPQNGYLKIDNNKTFLIKTATSGENHLTVPYNSELILSAGSKIIVEANNKLTLAKNGKILLGQSSEIKFKPGSLFCNLGGRILHTRDGSISGPIGKINFEPGYIQQACPIETPDEFYVGDSIKFTLDSSTVFEIPDSAIYRFVGASNSLVLKPTSKIKFGKDSKIILDSGATLIANNASFISSDTSETWEGIILNNSGIDSVINCTFSNAKTSLSIINDANHSNINRIIKGNTFNVPAMGVNRGIYGENNYRLLVQNNTFNMPVYYPSSSPAPIIYVGLYLKNSSTGGAAGEPEESEIGPYSLNIVGNTFNNGCASAILANYLSNLLPYNIKSNTFNHASAVNLIGMQIEGRIKYNNFTSDDVPIGIHLISSNPDLYDNSIESKEIGVHMTGNCYPRMGPYVSGGDMVWAGGNNSIITSECDNIQLESAGNIFTDWGNNSFTVLDDSSYHIYGWSDSALQAYYTRDNCWNSSGTPTLSLTKNNSQYIVPAVYYNAWLDCIYYPGVTGYNIVNLGNGIVDSTRLTSDITSYEPSEDELLLYTAGLYMGGQDYPNAIATLKALIETDTSFGFIAIAVDDLYAC